jgi:hypothetical protein
MGTDELLQAPKTFQEGQLSHLFAPSGLIVHAAETAETACRNTQKAYQDSSLRSRVSALTGTIRVGYRGATVGFTRVGQGG